MDAKQVTIMPWSDNKRQAGDDYAEQVLMQSR